LNGPDSAGQVSNADAVDGVLTVLLVTLVLLCLGAKRSSETAIAGDRSAAHVVENFSMKSAV
jgi:hypothetical protein